MSKVIIDWNAIRPLNGSSANGFEELCAQLARAESPAGSRFERKGTPDAGVECYAVLEDGSEWGWQAKYFDKLDDSQWSQLGASVKTALEKHPRLIRYFICVPLNRPDARIGGRQSAKERWDAHVLKWRAWASDRNMNVEFIYWGNHELIERLALPRHVGLVRFWFDVNRFDNTWFMARLEEALKTAGPRYTPEIHVELPIAAELEAFGRTERFFDRIKAHARGIRQSLQTFQYSDSKSFEPALITSIREISSKVQAVLAELGAITVQPIGTLPFNRIAEQLTVVEADAEKLENMLLQGEREHDVNPPPTEAGDVTSRRAINSFRECRYHLMSLSSELWKTHEAIAHAEDVAGRSLMLLKGEAGTGKTHLLCDVARKRIASDLPTVLLMGQRFISKYEPWTQALQQIDLPGISAEEFVGALEAAAQAADCRALVLIDAINEGSGRLIWPEHLPAFLSHLERSPWIGVLLSVRTSYVEIVVPEVVRASAVTFTHQGFTEHEYDATKTFFAHYGLELPSTPLLAPEFRNPLYLKTICEGLHETGQRRMPRGFHGITSTFRLFLFAINKRLADRLGFNPKSNLVNQALEAFTEAVVASGKQWLPLAKAHKVVNALLPERDFERSLYHGLVNDRILVEEAERHKDGYEEVVFIGYERFADHLMANAILNRSLGVKGDSPNSKTKTFSRFLLKIKLWRQQHRLFGRDGHWRFLYDQRTYVSPGLLEALCVQVSERTGYEMTELYPIFKKSRWLGDAFRQSLIWRHPKAFSKNTRDTLNKLIQTEHDWNNTLEMLLTVATLPDHPFNAGFLDQRLRKNPMPERDAWWSIYLHKAWQTHGSVDRLVDWATSVVPTTELDNETVDLCAIALAWMLTTSDRFLRDRATKALVSLLTGRLDAVVRLVERFADVDDPYVKERVYAVAYGTAMRSHDPAEVGTLAECIYTRVFASGEPPAHILLRDYARGVIERAIYLGARIDIVAERIRPPYQSQWPTIPTDDDIKPLLPDYSRGSRDSGELEWARNRIGSSVMHDDFATYVIGTYFSSHFLSLRLEEHEWQSPDDLLATLLKGFSDEERSAWERFKTADEKIMLQSIRIAISDKNAASGNSEDGVVSEHQNGENHDPRLVRAQQERDTALAALGSVLTEEHLRELAAIVKAKCSGEAGRPPHFDLRLIQRYILWRVFNLGWTTERFGYFDRVFIGYRGREAQKAERIGKKYQWIAYYEIMALVADHFQYRNQFYGEENDRAYKGPWQEHLRDIDPSCILRATLGGTSWGGHSLAWWGPAKYENWDNPASPRDWVMRYEDLPKLETLLSIVHPENATRWLNLYGYFHWQKKPPADQESYEIERRELWYIVNGYLINSQDSEALMKWAEGIEFYGRWMPESPTYSMFLGEYGWSLPFRYFQQQCCDEEGWIKPNHGCPLNVRRVASEYIGQTNSFDCSIDETFKLLLPAGDLLADLGLRWGVNGANYLDAGGRLAAFDPTVHEDGPTSLLIREDILKDFLARKNLSLCWTVLGEKQVIGPGYDPTHHSWLRISAAYLLGDKGPVGFLKYKLDERE